jgi:large conductance mechanosensitive channel
MRDFKNYIARSNVLDLVLAVVMAVAIVKVVDSLVVDIMMPLISHFAGNGADMGNYFIPIAKGVHADMTYDEARTIGAVIGYGQFIIALVYLIIAGTLFFLIARGLESLRRDASAVSEKSKAQGTAE